MRFLVDINVGALTRWLRAMGYDSVCLPQAHDRELAAVAMREGRVLVTRDHEFVQRKAAIDGRLRVVLVREQEVQAQLRQVVDELGLSLDDRAFSLCLRCNIPLRDRPKETLAAEVPPYVLQTQQVFMECPACRKVYWQGTHCARMWDVLMTVAAPARGVS